MNRGDGTPVRSVADALAAILLAPDCAACDRALEQPTRGPVCEDCWSSIRRFRPPVCRSCGDTLLSWRIPGTADDRCGPCRTEPTVLAMGRAVGPYAGVLERLVVAHKYHGRRSLAGRLAPLLEHAGRDVLAGAACVVPVPLHPWRRLRRGFNQAADLAACLGLPVRHALWRVRATPAQVGLHGAERRRNVRGAFRASPLLTARMRREISGGVVVLVDDVRTTGATLHECATVLKAMGASEVRSAVLAQAPVKDRA